MSEETQAKQAHEPEEYLTVAYRFVAEDEYGEPTCFIFFDGDESIAPFPNMAQPVDQEPQVERLLVDDLAPWIEEQGVDHIVITGGEPMKQGMCCSLIANLSLKGGRSIEVETNGISQIDPIAQLRQSMTLMAAFSATTSDDLATVSITMDHWLPGTEPLAPMTESNFNVLSEQDTVRFIAAGPEDLAVMEQVVAKHDLENRCNVMVVEVSDGEDPCDCQDSHSDAEPCHGEAGPCGSHGE